MSTTTQKTEDRAQPAPAPVFAITPSAEFYKHTSRHVGHGPAAALHCSINRGSDGAPFVSIAELIGSGDYRPAELRALAAKLNAVANDADRHPMGPRSFYRSYRRY